jgi:hypothetical protein
LEIQRCGANMTTSNTTLASDILDCLCVPGTRLVDLNNTGLGCQPCNPNGLYYQPLTARAASCLLCDAGTSLDGISCPPAAAAAAPIGAIIGGAAAAVVVVGAGATFLTYGTALFGTGKVAAAGGAMAFGGRATPSTFADVTLLLPSHQRRDAWHKSV